MSTELAEHREQLSPAQALALVKEHAKKRFDEEQKRGSNALKEIERACGGPTDKLERSVVDQGRAWATPEYVNESLRESLVDAVGEAIQDEVAEILERYEIVVPQAGSSSPKRKRGARNDASSETDAS